MTNAPGHSAHSRLPDAVRRITVDPDLAVAFQRVVEVALNEVPGVEFGGISELIKTSIRTRAASRPDVELVDRAQYDSGEGPCLTAALADKPVVWSGDLESDPRWPVFGPAAAALGVHAVISFKLSTSMGVVGALNLYAGRPYQFTPEAEDIGLLLAAHAATIMAASQKQANLTSALQSRDVIGQAKGILMERLKCDDREAFDMLIAISQHTHRKLRDVADTLRTTGELVGFDG